MRYRICRMALVAATTSALFAPTALAQSQSASSFGCRASAVRVDLPAPIGTIEPVRANSPGTPCATGAVGVVYPTALGPVSADAVRALTAREGTGPGSALASASTAGVALPGLDVRV